METILLNNSIKMPKFYQISKEECEKGKNMNSKGILKGYLEKVVIMNY
jgi:hypothetical protein